MRRTLGFSQGRLAEELGVTLLTVHRWEAGKASPHPLSRRRFAELEEGIATPGRAVALGPPPLDFAGNAEAISAVAEALCLAHGHQFNPAFAVETARVDALPHQRIAVYERMLAEDPLRFLLADDAGAGKTIMTGLVVREMLSRGRLRRVLIVPPRRPGRELGARTADALRPPVRDRRTRTEPRRQSVPRTRRRPADRLPRHAAPGERLRGARRPGGRALRPRGLRRSAQA